MRRAVAIVVLALGAAAIGVTAAQAEPSGACGGGVFAVSSSSASVCITQGPVTGSATAAYTGGTGGYIVADGDSTNQSIPGNCFDGYVGFQAGGGYDGPVAGGSGDYAYGPQPAPSPPSVPPCT